jgi:CHAD domain-containing protein
MRRLRVILALASQSQEDVELQDLREQVSSLCVELGRARDWDVFEANTLAPCCVRLPDYAGLREVLRACESKRIKQHKVMVGLLGSQNFQRLLLRFGAWLQTMPPDTVNVPKEIFVERTLKKRYKNVVRRGEAWILGDVEQLHDFRIACKKLRYSIELFETWPVSNKALVKLRVLTKLQDVLGRLNDIVVANRLMDDLDNPSRHESLMLVRDWLENDAKKLKFKIRRIWKRFLAQGRFKIKFGENTRKALNK